ncbi:MAG TPA: hypothetical protein VK735_06965, partial [Pseudonocardia sp.]|uniref:hypothetical protein n=1 Tax=Pseudonocardia sp. TaxID=60912 RepID=UPI002C3A011C
MPDQPLSPTRLDTPPPRLIDRIADLFQTEYPAHPQALGQDPGSADRSEPTPSPRPSPTPRYVTERVPEQPWRPTVKPKTTRATSSGSAPNLVSRLKTRFKAGAIDRANRFELNPGALIGMAVVLLFLAVLAFAYLGPWATNSAQTTDQQKQAVTGNVLELCGNGDDLARELHARGSCDVAEAANENPSITDVGRTDAEIIALIAKYMDDHPQGGARTDPGAIVEAARAVLAANPALYQGPAGPGPTEQQVASAAAAYISTHTADFQGAKGDTGDQGAAGAPG